MIRSNLKIAAAALAVASAFASTAHAAGFQLTEQSALALDRAYAGVGVDGTDISGIYYNPATMTLHPGTAVQMGLVGVGLNLEYVDQDGSKNNGRAREEVLPHIFASHQINDSTWVGLAVTIPYGLATDYGDDFKRKELGTDAKITVINFNPNVAWKLNDKFSLGAGLALQYVDAKFGVGYEGNGLKLHNEYSADNFTWGWNVGMMWAPVENVRFGISYRSETKHATNGDLKTSGSDTLSIGQSFAFGGTYDASVTVSGPAWAMFNAAWDVNDYLSLYATFRWADWSSFKRLQTQSPELNQSISNIVKVDPTIGTVLGQVAGALGDIHNNWVDTYLYSVGYDLRVNDFWTLRGGVAYETSAIGDPKTRTALIPDADRWWFAIGSSFHWSKNFQTDVAFAHLHGVHERSLYDHTSGANYGNEVGRYRHLDAYLLGIQAQYRF